MKFAVRQGLFISKVGTTMAALVTIDSYGAKVLPTVLEMPPVGFITESLNSNFCSLQRVQFYLIPTLALCNV